MVKLITKTGVVRSYPVAEKNIAKYTKIQDGLYAKTKTKLKVNIQRASGTTAYYKLLPKSILKRGYIYHTATRTFKAAATKTPNQPTPTETVRKQTLSMLEQETRIRDSIFHSIDRVNRKLSDKIPIAYDRDNDTWIANDYQGKHPIPIEIKFRLNEDGMWTVKQYQFRGKADKATATALQKELNYK